MRFSSDTRNVSAELTFFFLTLHSPMDGVWEICKLWLQKENEREIEEEEDEEEKREGKGKERKGCTKAQERVRA